MNRHHLTIAGVLFLTASAGAQNKQEIRVQREEVIAYQQSGMVTAPGSETVMAGMIGANGKMGLLNVTGRPLSATEVRRTVQMLANGAKIENSDSNLYYRDDQGRTRVEQTIDGKTTIVIMDPVARFVAVLDRAAKTVRKTPIPAEFANGNVSMADGKVMVRMGNLTSSREIVESHSTSTNPSRVELRVSPNEKLGVPPHLTTTDLGEKTVNGVTSQGTRETRSIPAGAIGNDRELQMVDERWFSSDLQLVIRSVNSDPRFGETTYQLTNIVRSAQDPALFQVPADYTVTDTLRLNLPEMKPPK